MRDTLRETPWGTMTYLDYRYRVEFDRDQYIEVADHALLRGLEWFASPWDVPSVLFLEDLQRRRPQDRVGVRHRHPAAGGGARHRQTGDPLHRHVDHRADRCGDRRARHRPARADARHVHVPDGTRRGEPAGHPDAPRPLPGRPGRLLRPRARPADLPRRRRAGRGRGGAAHHPGSHDVGFRPRRLARADGSAAPRPRHPHRRRGARRRREARVPRRARTDGEAAARLT